MKTKHTENCNEVFKGMSKGESRVCLCETPMNTVSHTPTPWRTGCENYGTGYVGIETDGGEHCRLSMLDYKGDHLPAKANAELIVRAVNEYDSDKATIKALVEAAKAALRCSRVYDTDQKTGETAGYLLAQAIAQAEGK